MPPKSGNERPLGARDPGQTRRPPDPVFTADPAGGPPTPTAASAAVARYSSDVPSQARQGPSRPSSRTSMTTVTASAHGPPTSDSEMQDYGTPSESADDGEAVPKGDTSALAIDPCSRPLQRPSSWGESTWRTLSPGLTDSHPGLLTFSAP
ncbi:hypothetical protein GALMADRAFT_132774 [Galerina marginata CBS 339.88]|uniref:Uncharacterized protein n=1 Tax=Galerina marginata (strain CBS 339.88) TaxID=685588 RepID=A0A067TLU2_GALM3|nr:hypothetical protein GALMADRAFT_132774 [Galerina marginata CBS 339.88]